MNPGDILLQRAATNKARSGETTRIGKLIQAGERARYGDTDLARWTHTALIVSADGKLVEALESGVHETHISKYAGTDYSILGMTATPEQRALAVAFARAHVGEKYGILDFVSLALQSVFDWNLSFTVSQQMICSELVARATEKYIASYPLEPANMMPADLAHYWKSASGEPPVKLGGFGKLLNLLLLPRNLLR